MTIYEYTNKGCREENQDYICHGSLPDDGYICILTDGMGGYSSGNEAAKTVAESIREYIQDNYSKIDMPNIINEAITYSNDELMLKRLSIGSKRMGCVIALLVIAKEYAYINWLGDSRVYMFRNGKEVYRTEDHSMINEMVKSNAITADNIRKYSSVVTRSIMGEDNLKLESIVKIKIKPNDVFILCSDGVHRQLNIEKLIGYTDSLKDDYDIKSTDMNDNYSFIKIVI
jgi:protein phosphatase